MADVAFTLRTPSIAALKRLIPSYAPFCIAEPAGPVILTADIADGLENTDAEGEELGQFDCGGTNHAVYRLEDGGYKFVISTLEGSPASAMRADARFSHCRISLFGDDADQQFGVGNAMMIAFAFAAAHYGIILMHASVTMNSGCGMLFLGKSGTGKSTHSQMWRKYIPGSDLLNDDNPAVRYTEADGAVVYGTPWSGKTPCYRNLKMPVGAYVRLEQYPENIIRREHPLQAFASILSSCSTMIWDKPSYQAITRTAEAVAMHVPVFYLRCRADEEAAQMSHSAIFGKE